MRHLTDAGHIGREFHDQRTLGIAFRGSNNFIQSARITAELDAAMLGVWAGNVQFVSGNAFAFVQNLYSVLVVFAGVAKDIGNHHRVLDLAQFGQFFVDESSCANVLQANGIEHSCGCLIKPWRRIPDDWLAREAFDDEAAEPVQVHDIFELDAVPECPAGGDDRVLQFDPGETYPEVRRHAGLRHDAVWGKAFAMLVYTGEKGREYNLFEEDA